MNKDQKLLHQLGFSDEQILTVKTSGSGTPSGSSADSSTSSSSSSSGVFSSSYAMEQVLSNNIQVQNKNVTSLSFAFGPYRFARLCPFLSDKSCPFRTVSLRNAGIQWGEEDAQFVSLLNHRIFWVWVILPGHCLLLLSYISLHWFIDFPLLGHSH